MIYLDNASTTRLSPTVFREMEPFLKDDFGNPGSLHDLGIMAKAGVDKARKQVAASIGAEPGQIIFTSGGSEANNLMVRAVAERLRTREDVEDKKILISKGEHESLVKAVESLMPEFEVKTIPLLPNGSVATGAIEGELKEGGVGAVFVMCVNNETGAINSVSKIGRMCRRYGALFGADLVQTMGYFPLDMSRIDCDYATISSHKIHGPKGAGALYAWIPDMLTPLIYGGDAQEFGFRGGTENVPAIVGFGKACEMAADDAETNGRACLFYKAAFLERLKEELEALGMEKRLHINGSSITLNDCGKILSLRIDGIDGQSLVLAANTMGLAISAGSACHADHSIPSETLLGMGLTPDGARQTVRVSFDAEENSIDDIQEGAKALAKAAAALDRLGKYDATRVARIVKEMNDGEIH